jgi:hypothetical protein
MDNDAVEVGDGGLQFVVDYLVIVFSGVRQLPSGPGKAALNGRLVLSVPPPQPSFVFF